jgi:hypothetical protein
MGKRNKIRYQSKPKEKVRITLTGQVYLRYEDEEAIAQPKRGDLLVYPCNDALNTTRQGDYYATGFSGYFKVDVFEGNVWCAVIANSIFAGKENHFSKTECPIDTYELCVEKLRNMAGTALVRTYREHYIPEDAEDEESAG